MGLQFGHGTEPWRNHIEENLVDASLGLQFGHGTEPWRNSNPSGLLRRSTVALRFGHGTEPWRNREFFALLRAECDPSIRPRHGAVEKPSDLHNFGRNPPPFNSATARSRGETLVLDEPFRFVSETFNSATARSRGETTRRALAQRPANRAFNSATARSRGEAYFPVQQTTGDMPFNSATARSRGETIIAYDAHSPLRYLQFGHGTEPWRNAPEALPALDFADILRFGHGTEPWRNLCGSRL